MKKIVVLCVFLTSLIVAAPQDTSELKYLKAFPEATDSTTRFVLSLPHKERGEDETFKVELVVGKSVEVDGVNRVKMATSLKATPLQGWGFTYYEMEGSDALLSTRMAPKAGTPKVTQFVGGTPLTLRYNSRVPIVIYVPKGFEVRYRIWEAPDNFETIIER